MKTVLACVATAFVVAATTATAASLISGSQIKPGSIPNRAIHKNALTTNRLSPGLQKIIKRITAQSGTATPVGVTGATGAAGVNGINGTNGAAGATGATGAGGPKGDPAITPIAAAGNGFSATNSKATFTADGVQIVDPSGDGSQGGSLRYDGLNGLRLKDVAQLLYTAQYNQTPDMQGGMPYLRIFLDGDTHDVIFSPNTQTPNPASQPIRSGKTQHFDVVNGLVRFDDDAGDGSTGYTVNGKPWDYLISQEGNRVISGVYISEGFSGAYSANTTALVNSLTTEATGQPLTQFDFGS